MGDEKETVVIGPIEKTDRSKEFDFGGGDEEFKEGPTVFVCGPSRPKHVCDDKGPVEYGLNDGRITNDKKEAQELGCFWFSVTCSKCGQSAMDRSMWEG